MKKVIRYTASWCGPCKMFAPIFDRLIPTPPPTEVNFINSALVKPIPLIESGVSTPKHEIGKPLLVPILDNTGEASPNHPFHKILKNLFSKSGLFSLSRISGRGTEITTLPGGQNLINQEYF